MQEFADFLFKKSFFPRINRNKRATIKADTEQTSIPWDGGVLCINTRLKGKRHAMMKKGLPLGFMAALVQDKRAMQNFARMSEREQNEVLSRVRTAKSKADMQLIVMSISDSESAVEYH